MILFATLVALCALAANSVLIRFAVVDFAADPLLFAVVRVMTGAVVLGVLALAQRGGAWPPVRRAVAGAVCLGVYLVGFSLAYRSLDAGFGALLLFGWVQISIFTTVVLRGHRPRAVQWGGAVVAFSGLAYLLRPQGGAWPDVDLMCMIAAGISWGFYTLLGRGAGNPVRVNAASFVICAVAMLPLVFVTTGYLTMPALALAMVSGGITSGLGYALWYFVVARIEPATAGVAQLAVPVIAALMGLAIIGEPISLRLIVGGALVLGGIGLSLWPRKEERRP